MTYWALVSSLAGQPGQVNSLALSRDGQSVAWGMQDGTVKLWDATTLSPEMEAMREARGVVETLFAKPLPLSEAVAFIGRQA